MTKGHHSAFPVIDDIQESGNGICGVVSNQVGLTKREYFAAMAMQTILIHHDIVRRIAHQEDGAGAAAAAAALIAAECADALIAELSKNPSSPEDAHE